MTRLLWLALWLWVSLAVGCEGCDAEAEELTPAEKAAAVGGAPFDDVVKLVAGEGETCVVVDSGQTYCAGGSRAAYDREVVLAGPMAGAGQTVQLSVGSNTCAVQQDGSAVCWGENRNRAMPPPFARQHDPERIEGLPPVSHVLANLAGFPDWGFARDESAVWTIGGTSLEPAQVPPKQAQGLELARVEQVASSNNAYCARHAGGKLTCWDLQGFMNDELGVSVKGLPVELPHQVVDVGVSYPSLGETQGVCALDADGRALCWQYTGPQLTTARLLQHPLADGTRWKDIDLGVFHSCGVKRDGSVWCAGDNSYGQLGAAEPEESSKLLQVPGVEGAESVTVGRRHSCVLLRDRSVMCWGHNTDDQCSTGQRGDRSPPSPFLRHVGAPVAK